MICFLTFIGLFELYWIAFEVLLVFFACVWCFVCVLVLICCIGFCGDLMLTVLVYCVFTIACCLLAVCFAVDLRGCLVLFVEFEFVCVVQGFGR